MGQDKENQPFAFTNSAPNAIWQSRTVHTPAPLPLLISKKWLCIHFNLIGPGGKANTEALYSKVLTREVLTAAGLTETEVRRREVRTFDRTTTLRLSEALQQ